MTDLERLLFDLVSINSINPDLVPGAPGEAEIASFIARWLEQAGLEVHIDYPRPGRPNVIGIARGSGGGRALMLNGHIDTVSVTGMQRPFQPEIKAGRLYGRGAYDMKGGLAAGMAAAAAAVRQPLRGDVILCAVMDEEYAGLGSLALAERYHAEGAIVAESTELQLIPAHKGFVWLEIETQGVAAHGSRPELGVDAIAKMGSILVALDDLDHALRAHPTHPLLGSGSLHASLIQGGRELSSYADRCLLSLERRTIPGETAQSVQAELQAILAGLRASHPELRADVRLILDRAPLETPANAEIVSAVQRSATQVSGHPAAISGVPYWTDAASLSAAGIPSVLFGPSGAGAHAIEEWVDLSSVQSCADIFLQTALDFCS